MILSRIEFYAFIWALEGACIHLRSVKGVMEESRVEEVAKKSSGSPGTGENAQRWGDRGGTGPVEETTDGECDKNIF